MMGFLYDAVATLWFEWTDLLGAIPLWNPYGALLVPLLLGAIVTLVIVAGKNDDVTAA
ncbi:MAG: hypothetical protein QF893_03130 [Alphaproteobacteria bacterium]|jgi:hypothetical protein|nr:hypothetical protein [Alphaproteobacteria bacterium]